jgi:G3E family GTPase
MNRYETPVLLLTGYLGSGKTTLLNRILSNQDGIRFAVIVNDIGEVNIDASLIQKGGIVDQQDDSLIALQNGCICCTLKMDLVEQLHDIISMQRFDYIVIEASGICEPGPIAQTICSIPSMEQKYTEDGIPRIDCIATVVDALRMQSEFDCGEGLVRPGLNENDIENLVIQQIEFCNIVLLNKADLVSPSELERVSQIIRALQPHAEIIPCNFGDVPLEKIIHTGMFDFERVATSAAWISKIENYHGEEDGDEDEHEHHHHHHHDGHHCHDEHCHCHHHHHGDGEALEYGIGTFVYYRRRPMDLSRFDHFVARNWPRSIIRAKGICYFRGEKDTCYVFEQAGKQIQMHNAGQWYATMPEEDLQMMLERDAGLRRDWDPEYGDRMQKIVFIGQNMDKEEIIRQLDGCLV